MILVQISDTHIDEPGALVYGHFDTSRALARAVDVINAMDPGPDLVLHTGDIASHGSVPRYQAFKEIVGALNVPLAVIPGNHDERNALRQVFGMTNNRRLSALCDRRPPGADHLLRLRRRRRDAGRDVSGTAGLAGGALVRGAGPSHRRGTASPALLFRHDGKFRQGPGAWRRGA